MTIKQKERINILIKENSILKRTIKNKGYTPEIIYKDIKEKPIPKEDKYYLEIISNYPNERGRMIFDSIEKIKKFVDNKELMLKVMLPDDDFGGTDVQ